MTCGSYEGMWSSSARRDGTFYIRDHCSPTLSTWKSSYTPGCFFFVVVVVVVVYMIILIEYFGRRELLIPTENFGVLQPVVYPMLYCIDLSSTAISTYEWNSKPVSIFNVVYRTIFLLGYLSEGNLLHQMMKVEFYN